MNTTRMTISRCRARKSACKKLLATAALLLAAPLASPAQNAPGASTLGNLIQPRGGKLAHFSSYDRSGGNADFSVVRPGETHTLMDYKGGAGIVRRWWITIAPRNNREIQRQLIVRCYWDGETQPSVEVPVSDFFGMGFGEWRDYQSLPLNMTSGGYNCYWAMPFRRSARITVENRSKVRIDAFYYNLDVETHKTLPKDTLYFHAQFRRVKPNTLGKPYTILETTGKGQYVGTLLSMQATRGRGLGYLEGDEIVTVDGEKTPSVIGTGTEDYFSSGWYYDTGVYSAPYHGVTIKDDARSRINTYRWHIEDPIPFEKSLRFDIEHGGVNDAPNTDYSSVAFYYQTHPHPRFPPLPADLMPIEGPVTPKVIGIVEGESLAATAKATGGDVSIQEMGAFVGDWSDLSQLWWHPGKSGERLTLSVNAPEAKEYELIGYFTRAKDYGDVQVSVNGVKLPNVVRGYNPDVTPSGPVSLGRAAMKAGANEVVLETVGKDDRSSGYLVGLDGFMLKP
jgi:hypothetical protein